MDARLLAPQALLGLGGLPEAPFQLLLVEGLRLTSYASVHSYRVVTRAITASSSSSSAAVNSVAMVGKPDAQ